MAAFFFQLPYAFNRTEVIKLLKAASLFELGPNDDTLSVYKVQLSQVQAQKADDEEFLQKLFKMCVDKAKQFQERVSTHQRRGCCGRGGHNSQQS